MNKRIKRKKWQGKVDRGERLKKKDEVRVQEEKRKKREV